LINDMNGGGSWGKIWAEISIAFIILIAACFNYTNLTIARALTRAKEVGIRKVAGAVRSQVFTQYIIESVVIALFALALAHVFLQFILEYKPFNDGYEMVPVVTLDITIVLWFVLFAIVTGIIAGSAPAWILSAFKPVSVLKNISTKKLFGNITLQKTLIVFQFSLSLVVIIFLSAFYRQFSFLGTADNGFQTKNILTVSVDGVNPELFSNEVANIAGVEHVAPLSTNFGRQATGTMYATAEKGVQSAQLDYYYADAELLPAMQLKLIAGTNFPANSERNVLLNETAAAALKTGVNNFIWINDSTQLQVAGIVKDFHYAGAGRMIRPLALLQKPGQYTVLNISVTASNKEQLLAQVHDAWNKTYPGRTFTSSWLDKELRQMSAQTATISLLGFLAFMTVTIACLGLLGL
ncbi:MAG TPA: FtsX-like permease family protein, partial [Chitinophagaceae bacterium]|nr:FtsX-like permease family protein [Chitinophagaceae bacterium]